MKKKIVEIVNGKITDLKDKKINRKEALKKAGYIAVSAVTMMILFPNKAQADASALPPY